MCAHPRITRVAYRNRRVRGGKSFLRVVRGGGVSETI